ncbi:MAG: LysM peptidoglycan-binding domain-containing protein [Oligoflexales bacterium]|nr:LysM peptidoglycan-binding domain-containing protein [Oligoflexales bacterium]
MPFQDDDQDDYALENELVESDNEGSEEEEQSFDDPVDDELVSSEESEEDVEDSATEEVVEDSAAEEDYASSEVDSTEEDTLSNDPVEDSLVEEEPVYEEPAEPTVVEEEEAVDPMIANTEPYTIRKGDWLSKIAKRRLGDAMLWPKVWVLNPQIENPHLIYPGDVITVPKHRYAKQYVTKDLIN